jgi:hypothetical protein
MLVSNAPDLSRARRDTFVIPDGTAAKLTIIASPEDRRPSPNAFIVEQSPHSKALAHFHNNSQFQVVIAGGGRIGPHGVAPLSLHYAGQQTAYGPIVAGDNGITYMTLRGIMEDNAFLLPEAKSFIDKRIPKYQTYTPVVAPAAPAALALLAEPDVIGMIAPQEGGLAAWLVRVPPSRRHAPPAHGQGAGRYYMVTGGELVIAGETLTRFGCAWLDPAEANTPIEAGATGVELLVLQFPANAWAFSIATQAAYQERADA